MKRLALIAVILILALGAMGAVYTYWNQNLPFNAVVSTGTYDVKFSELSVVTNGDSVANCSSELTNNDHNLKMTVTGAFPGFYCNFVVKAKSTGTTPAKFALPEIRALPGVPSWGPHLSIANTCVSASLTQGEAVDCTLHFEMDPNTVDLQAQGPWAFDTQIVALQAIAQP
jgi:hypothetical protein